MNRIVKWSIGALISLALLAAIVLGVWVRQQITHALAPAALPPGQETILAYRSELEPDPEPLAPPARARAPGTLLEVAAADRPWARWWWPGADVEPRLIQSQLDTLREAGFGGVEIQPFSLGLAGIEDPATRARVFEFDTPRYFKALDALMSHAAATGMQVHLNHLSGWPAGGPQVPVEAGMHEYAFAERRVKGGRSLKVALPTPRPGLNAYAMALFELTRGFDAYNFVRGQDQLVSVLAARPVAGTRSRNPLDGRDTLTLDPESVRVLDEFVIDGELVWDAPEGDWLIVATYLVPAGEPPILVATPQPGYVIDHLNPANLVAHYNYAFGPRTGLDRHYGKGFSGFFNDSLEYKLDVMASADLLDLFQARRGYDLRPFLPLLAVDGWDNFYLRDAAQFRANPRYRYTSTDDRVRHDFLSLRSELIIERFVAASASWAEARGLQSRGQSYGFDLDVIRALGANHIPETEQLYAGGSELFLKMASSAGELYDRERVSAESFVWKARDYALSPKHLKAGADLLLYSGINQVVYHGVTYRTTGQANDHEYRKTFGLEGWFPWSQPGFGLSFSMNAGPANPLWEVIPELNAYLARSQALLRQGRADVDVYIHYPFLGLPTAYGSSREAAGEFLFNGYMPDEGPESAELELVELPFFKAPQDTADSRIEWLERLRGLTDALNAAGVTWRFVNDHALIEQRVGRPVGTASGRLPAVLFFETPALALETARALAEGNDTRYRVFFMGEAPRQVPGFLDFEAREVELRSIMDGLAAGRVRHSPEALLRDVEGTVRFAAPAAVRRNGRLLADGRALHFLANQSIHPEQVRLRLSPVHRDGRALSWFDPMSGAQWPAGADATGEIALDLAPLQSMFLLVGEPASAPAPPLWTAAPATAWKVLEPAGWTMTAEDLAVKVGAEFPDLARDGRLKFAATVVYETVVSVPEGAPHVLDLGDVDGVASVAVNGIEIGQVAFAPYLVDISGALSAGDNLIAVTVRMPLRNALVKRALEGEPQYAQHLRHQGELAKGGLRGPVRMARLL